MNRVFLFILLAFVVYRLALLISKDTLTEPLRKPFGQRAAGQPRYSRAWYLAELINCPYCTGVWFAFALTFALLPASLGEFLLYWLALAGLQAFFFSLGGR